MESAAVAVSVDPVPIVRDTHDSGGHLQQAFDACADGLYRYVLIRVGGDRHAADDLLQQACCVAARHWRQPANANEYEAWLRGIARNLIRQHWRCLRKERRRVPLENAEVARQLVERMESGRNVVFGVDRLPHVVQQRGQLEFLVVRNLITRQFEDLETVVQGVPFRVILPALLDLFQRHQQHAVNLEAIHLLLDLQQRRVQIEVRILTADEGAIRAEAQMQAEAVSRRVAADRVHKEMALLKAMEAEQL